MKKSEDDVVVRLTRKQAEHLHALLDGFIDRESFRMSRAIIRKTMQIGKRLSDAAGWGWRHQV